MNLFHFFSKNKVAKNASWIIVCSIIQSLISLIIGMITARYLGSANYGLINYASSIVTFFVPIMQLGLTNIMVQELTNHPEREGKILGTSLIMSLISGGVCVIGVFLFVLMANAREIDTIFVCLLYSSVLIVQSCEVIKFWYQANYHSKYTSIVSLCVYVIVSLYKIFLLIANKSVYWFAVSMAFDYLLIGIASFVIYKKLGGQKFSVDFRLGKKLISKSKYYIVSSMMVVVFSQTDKIMLKLMLDSSATGYYSAAVTIASITSFVFAAIIDSMRPSVFEGAKISHQQYENRLRLLYSIIIYLSLAQSIGMCVFAKLLIYILYGTDYMSAVSALRIIVWYTTFSYLGSVRNIWILQENKQKYLWIINASGALANVILNTCFIPLWGVNGAAFASLVTQIFTNVIIGFILRPIRHNNTIMFQSLNPKYFIKSISVLLNKR